MRKEMLKVELSAAEVAAALAIGSAALLVLGLQPILLGELLEARQVTLEGVGLVAMAEIVALGVGVLLGDLVQPLMRLRSVTALAALALDALTLKATGDLGFALICVHQTLPPWPASSSSSRPSRRPRWASCWHVRSSRYTAGTAHSVRSLR